jgi:hypothetical protein
LQPVRGGIKSSHDVLTGDKSLSKQAAIDKAQIELQKRKVLGAAEARAQLKERVGAGGGPGIDEIRQ